MKNSIRVSFYAMLAVAMSSFKFAERQPVPSIFESLNYQELLKVELETNIDSILNSRKTDATVPARFSYKDANGKEQNWDIEVQTRGKFRRRLCEMPPLKLIFPKDKIQAAGFKKHNKFKLVVHCLDTPAGDEFVLREYMAYKLYQILTPESYRIQLLRIKYKNTGTYPNLTHYGILIEDEDEMAERLEGNVCDDCFGTPKEDFRQDDVNMQDLFQYFIGNTDWDINMIRNVKLLKCKKDNKCILVPYDFDFSGFVNTSYASVDKNSMGVTTVQQRVFRGFAQSPEELKTAIELFKSKQKDMQDCIKKFKLPSSESKAYMLNYMDSFFKCLEAGLDLKTPGKC